MNEIWKDVVDYEGIYDVSNLGNIRRSKTKRVLKQRIDMYGYKKVNLSKNGKARTRFVHRIVAISFIENVDNKPQVNHKDTNKENNEASNLEWSTSKENMKHMEMNGLSKYKILSQWEVNEIRRLQKEEKLNHIELSNKFNVSRSTIYSVMERIGRYETM